VLIYQGANRLINNYSLVALMLEIENLIDQIRDAVIVTDLDGIIVKWNHGAMKQLGYKDGEVVGKPVHLLYPDVMKKFDQGMIISILEEKGELQFESTMQKKSGEEIQVHTSLSPIADDAGQIIGVVSYTLDITEQKRIEEQLRQQAQLIDQIHDAVIVTDLNSNIIQWNKGAQSQLGYTEKEIVGCPIYILYSEEKKSIRQTEIIMLLKKHGSLEFEAVMCKKSGERVIVHTALSPVTDSKGNIVSVISYTLDITEQKKAEQAQREKELIERDLDIAKSIQQGLLPSEPPDIEGFQVAGWNQAADQTGGDYFDWVDLPDGRTAISIADVSGHGIGPALIVAACRAYFRATTGIEESLNSVMARVNYLISKDLTSGRFVTAAVGIIDPSDNSMQFYSAGHAPIFFYNAKQNKVLQWDADDPPLGIIEGVTSNTNRILNFNSGDILVLVTDGFLEWANPNGERFGVERLEKSITDYKSFAPDVMIKRLHQNVLDFSNGTPQADDLTAVVIKRT